MVIANKSKRIVVECLPVYYEEFVSILYRKPLIIVAAKCVSFGFRDQI